MYFSIGKPIAYLNRIATNLTIFNITLLGYTWVQKHRDFGKTIRALKEVFEFHDFLIGLAYYSDNLLGKFCYGIQRRVELEGIGLKMTMFLPKQ